MKSLFTKIWSYKTIYRRVGYTIFFLLLFRLGTLITIPGITWIGNDGASTSSLSSLAALGGGVISRFSLFAVGISPFITASIIVQLLSTGLIPGISNWLKQGRKGQTKLNYLTKFLTLPIGYLQSLGIIFALAKTDAIEISGVFDKTFYEFFLCPMILVGGTMLTLFIADLISNKGIGQGTSIIIFTGILAVIPQQLVPGINSLFNSSNVSGAFDNHLFTTLTFITYLILLLLLIVGVVYFSKAERRIPIQQTGAGLRLRNQQKSYLPIKFNPSGVIPVIFASTLFSFFTALSAILEKTVDPNSGFIIFVNNYFSLLKPTGVGFFALFVFIFALIYAHIAINCEQLSENLQRSGSYIPGILPGNRTTEFVSRVVTRISFFGAIYLAIIASFAFFINLVLFENNGANLGISGTSILILVLIGENILNQIRDLKIQVSYIDLRDKKKDIFLWST